MRNTLKFTVAICVLCAAVAVPSFAQQENPTDQKAPTYRPVSLSLAGIGTTAGGATTTCTNLFIDVRGMQSVTLQTKFNFGDTTTTNVVYTISKSINKTDWETADRITWTVAGNSTTDVIATTNITTGSAGWLKLDSIQNTHASIVLTNKSFIYGIKRNSP